MSSFKTELAKTMDRNKPYVRCKYYNLARSKGYRDLSFVVTERPNGEIETRGCQDCNGYNILCDVYKEWYLREEVIK
jgi:hypothetical protein